jgi:hypothetical protein
MTEVIHNPFEEMLAQHQKNTQPLNKPSEIKPLKAADNATLDDFIKMLVEICSKALKPWQAELNPDEGAVLKDDDKTLNNPVILYEVINRVPKLERKPRQLEDIVESTGPDGRHRFGRTWSQRFSCVIQFNIIASDYSTANKVMDTLEDTIFTYTGYFKSKGVAELIFKRHFTDKNYDRYRQWLSVRSLQYDIEIEKLTTVFDTTIEDISI